MAISGSDSDDTPSISSQLVGRQESFSPDSGLRRHLAIWGSKLSMVVVLAAAAMGLARFASDVNVRDRALASPGGTGSGTIITSEVVCVWLPAPLFELASRPARAHRVLAHADVRRYLEERGLQGLWYAVTIRGHLVDGDVVDMQFLRQPYSEPERFDLLFDILAIAAEWSGSDCGGVRSTGFVRILPKKLALLARPDAVAALQRDPDALDNVTKQPEVAPMLTTGEPPRQSR